MADEWVKIRYAGRMRYFRRDSLRQLYEHLQFLVVNARCVLDPDEIRLAEEMEKRNEPLRKLLTEQDIVDRAAAKGR